MSDISGAVFGHHGGDGEASVAAIHPEVVVQRQDATRGILFRHADKTGVGQGHRHGRVAGHELADTPDVLVQVKRHDDGLAFEQFPDRGRAAATTTQQEARFGDDSLAGPQRYPLLGDLRGGPTVVTIPPVEKRDQRAGIEQRARGQRPNPRRWRGLEDRSVGPVTQPTRSPAIAANERGRRVRRPSSAASSASRRRRDFLTRRCAAAAARRAASGTGTFTEIVVMRFVIRACHYSNTRDRKQR